MAKRGKKSPSKKKAATVAMTTEVTVAQEESHEVVEGTLLSSQQALFLQLYYDRESPTWGNAKQSAIAAGFEYNYANQITYKRPEWWVGFVRQQGLIEKIEEHFAEVMSLPNIMPAMGAFGPVFQTKVIVEKTGQFFKTGTKRGQEKTRKVKVKELVMVPNVAVIKAKNEVAKIAAPAHDPDRYGKKPAGNKFIFNIKPDRERFA